MAFGRTAGEVGRASRDFADTARQIQAAVSTTAGEANTALREVTRVAAALERDSTAAVQRANTAIEIGSLEITATANELRSTAEIVARTFDRFRDPRAALLGPSKTQLGPGERHE